MPIPQVNDRIKEAPVVVLRAVFAGIGQLLLTAEKVRTRAVEQVWTPDQPAGPGPAGPSPSWAATATKTAPGTKATATKTAPADKATATTKTAPAGKATTKPAAAAKATATTKPASEAKRASTTKPAAKAASTTKPAAKAASTTKPASEAETASDAKAAPPAEPAPAAPPLPGYDDLSLPSLRARLRALDATTIKAMVAYEKAHARRANVISMLERRLAKITAE